MRSSVQCILVVFSQHPRLTRTILHFVFVFQIQEPERQYMHIGTMVEFAFALVAKLDVINKHSFNDFKLRVGEYHRILRRISWTRGRIQCEAPAD